MMIPFLYSLAGGMMVITATGQTDQFAWKFLRLVGVIVLAIVSGVTAWSASSGRLVHTPAPELAFWLGIILGIGGLTVVLIAPLAARIAKTFRGLCGLSGLLGLAAAALSVVARMDHQGADGPATVMAIANEALSGLLLGSVTVAWLLGHAYLTATKMTMAPLRHCTRWFSWSIVIRSAFALLSLTAAWLGGRNENPTILSHLGQAWLLVSLRVGAGLIAVGLFAYMVSDCVRLRSTQSATGILYFSSVFVYIGELASRQLILECGWPL